MKNSIFSKNRILKVALSIVVFVQFMAFPNVFCSAQEIGRASGDTEVSGWGGTQYIGGESVCYMFKDDKDNSWIESYMPRRLVYITKDTTASLTPVSKDTPAAFAKGEACELIGRVRYINGNVKDMFIIERDSKKYYFDINLVSSEPACIEGTVFSTGMDIFTNPVTDSYKMDVPYVSQFPELNDGCEVTSLTMVLNYLGCNADKCNLAYKYLPKSDEASADPNEFYLGDPAWGWYCFAKPLAVCANSFCEHYGYPIYALDSTDISLESLYNQVREGRPVIVWATLSWTEPVILSTGRYDNLHCVVVSGFTDHTVTINDPMVGIYSVTKETFEHIFDAMGSRALVLLKSNSN